MEGNSKHGATCKGQISMPPYRVTTTYSVSSCTEVLRPRPIKANHYSVGENAGSEVAKAASDQHPCQWDRARSPSRFITGVLRTCMHFFFSSFLGVLALIPSGENSQGKKISRLFN